MESSQSFSAPPHGISPAALAGVRVVEMGQLIAGPFASKLLGEFGADVIKIESPQGDSMRGAGIASGDLLVVEFFSAGMFRHREWIYDALRAHFPGCRFHSFADEHVQKQESFDFHGNTTTEPAVITEYGIKFRADPAGAHKTGFFADQRENRQWLSQQVEGRSVLDLCCNTGGFAVYAAARGASEVVGVDIDQDVIQIAKGNARLNNVRPKFVQADICPWLREAANRGERYDAVVLDIELGRERHAGVALINAINKLRQGTPVLVVSAMPAAIYRSIMKALDAWDYLQKTTFEEADFIETFLDILRTTQAQAPASVAPAPVGDALVLDPLWQRTPTWRGERINLPLTAQRILATLHQRSGEVVSYDELFEVVKSGRNRDNVRKHVSTIREALREVDPSFEGIENVPMRGFRWTGK